MSSSSRPASRRWLWLLIGAGVLTQTALNLLRPITTYKVVALGGGEVMVGLNSAVYAVVPLFSALALGRFTDRSTRLFRLVQAAALVLAVGGAVLATAPSLGVLLCGSVLLGMGHLMFTISGQASVARLAADHDLDLGFGWFTASYSLGQAIGPLLGGAVVGTGAVTGRLGAVNLALWVGGAIAFLAAPLFLIPTPAAPRASAEDDTTTKATVPEILRTPGVSSNMLASLTLLASMDIVTAFLPLVGERAGVAPVVVGWLLAIRGVASILSRTGLPLLANRFSRRTLLISSVAFSGIAVGLIPVTISSTVLCGAAMFVGGFFLGLGQPLTMTAISTAVPRAWRSQALAVRLMGNRVGQVGFPTLAGLLAAPLGPSAAIWVAAAALLVSAAEKTVRL